MTKKILLILALIIALNFSTYANILVKDYTTYFSLRELLEQNGYTVTYEESKKRILGSKEDSLVRFRIGHKEYYINAQLYTLEHAPFIHSDGLTYVSIDTLLGDNTIFLVSDLSPIIDLILNKSLPNEALADNLSMVVVTYLDYNATTRTGILVVHKDLALEVMEIFQEIYAAQFPIAEISLVDKYDADDYTSMIHNNTSAFNYRFISGTTVLSNHALGEAIDINPLVNPHVIRGVAYPAEGAPYINRNTAAKGMIKEGDAVYNAFINRGWSWGGHWTNPDYQHFEK